MENELTNTELLRLFDGLQLSAQKHLKKSKGALSNESLIFDLIMMTQNNRTKLLTNSAVLITPEIADKMLSRELIQSILSDEGEKFALTFKGIAECIRLKEGRPLEDQFKQLIGLCDKKFRGIESAELNWKEKLVSLSLILLASTSESSKIRLDIDGNKMSMTEVFKKTIDTLEKYGIISKTDTLKNPASGEHPVVAVMRRVNNLSRKTNLYYVNDAKDPSSYYFDIEQDGKLNKNKCSFLFRRIFENYNLSCNYRELYEELAIISQQYTPRFRARTLNQTIVFDVLLELKSFTNDGIMHLTKIS